MALVYSQELIPSSAPVCSGNNIMNYSRDHAANNTISIDGTGTVNVQQHLCYQQSLCNSEYLSTPENTTDHSPLINYPITACPLYRPTTTGGLSTEQGGGGNDPTNLLHPSLTGTDHDVSCYMLDPSTDIHNGCGTNSNSSTSSSAGPVQGLNWQAFMVDKWYCMRDRSMQDITHDEITSGFIVEADKGFNYSLWDESFVCQKKNHFQISIQLKLPKVAKYLKKSMSDHEMEIITCFGLHLHGMKFEAVDSVVMIEQSKTDRSKLAYEPLLIDVPNFPDQLVKVSACRLHFSETTANNMRKRGKPNPDQRYFSLVVSLHAYTASGNNYPVVAYVSERIIVRASNPGQFDNEGDSTWLKGISLNGNDTVFYHGKVGINTESPEEALTVIGNMQVTGQILQPSDARLKKDISEMNTEDMLRNMQQLTLYSYIFEHETFDEKGKEKGESEERGEKGERGERREETGESEERGKNGEDICKDVGLLAQQVQMVIPDAVKTVTINNKEVLVLNKDRLMMECIGALQELSKRNRYTPKLSHLITILIILIISLICIALVIVLTIVL